jgi:hypothetical protein
MAFQGLKVLRSVEGEKFPLPDVLGRGHLGRSKKLIRLQNPNVEGDSRKGNWQVESVPTAEAPGALEMNPHHDEGEARLLREP